MATAENRGENLKSFVTRRKAEYRSKFPFLTDSQVVAKLKRLWKSQQARAALASDTNCELRLCLNKVFWVNLDNYINQHLLSFYLARDCLTASTMYTAAR